MENTDIILEIVSNDLNKDIKNKLLSLIKLFNNEIQNQYINNNQILNYELANDIKTGTYVLIKYKKEIIGFLSYSIINRNTQILLNQLYICNEYRNKKIGSTSLKLFHNFILNNDKFPKVIVIHCFSNSIGAKIYLSNGYRSNSSKRYNKNNMIQFVKNL